MAKMDGREKIVHPGYDALDKVVRGPHKHSREKGYEPEARQQEAARPKRVEKPADPPKTEE